MSTQQTAPQVHQAPLVSFIITYYQLPIKMLQECIESILALSLTDQEREIMLIDDGSEKSPVDDLSSYMSAITYVRQAHQGVSVARNTGIHIATGNYIQFVDGDDMLLKDAYQECLQAARTYQDDIITFHYTRKLSDKKQIIRPRQIMSGEEYMNHQNLRGSVCGYLFRRELLGSLHFTPGIDYSEDEEFTPQLFFKANSIYPTYLTAYFYRSHAASAIHQSHPQKITKRLDDTEKVIFHLQHICETLPIHQQSAFKRRIAQLTMDYLYEMMILKEDKDEIRSRIDSLVKKELFPLPNRHYTSTYTLFRWMTNTSIGRRLLIDLLPLTTKKR